MKLTATPAHTRALGGALLLCLLAVAYGRLDALIVALPLIAYIALAAALRPRTADAAHETPPAVAHVSAQRVLEDDPVTVEVSTTAPHTLLSVGMPAQAALRMTPRNGLITGAGATRLQLLPLSWGRYDMGPLVVQHADILGARRVAEAVSPPTISVSPGDAAGAGQRRLNRVLGISGPHLSATKGDGIDLASVRAFRTGDRVNRVKLARDPPAPARSTSTRCSPSATPMSCLITDTDRDVHALASAFADRTGSSLDLTVRAVAALASRYIGLGDRVRVHDFGSRIASIRRHRAGASAPHRGPARSRGRMSDPIRRLTPLGHVRSGTLTFVMSPLLTDEVAAEIGRLRAAGADVHVIDTMPAAITGLASRAARDDVPASHRSWATAWGMRVAERKVLIAQLISQGVPVAPWQGGDGR
ncbi:hypothetical protein [Helcobacillus massiliensis]|uniref:Uncharacterized protein (DUF58 family) n=1 Tax=Helcobacillus massiliensis TaxID=521392 RepID=A0A839QTP5_9MICO|nr:hypothetical protein [Helcobacillus massiliensis]MBB3023105.1 uncharacterized protein (DUF58 family) [Helcobacillus massiliensis]